VEVECKQQKKRSQQLRPPDNARDGFGVNGVGREQQRRDRGQRAVTQKRLHEACEQDAGERVQPDVADVKGGTVLTKERVVQTVGRDGQGSVEVAARTQAVVAPVIGREDRPQAGLPLDPGVTLDDLIVKHELAGNRVRIDHDRDQYQQPREGEGSRPRVVLPALAPGSLGRVTGPSPPLRF